VVFVTTKPQRDIALSICVVSSGSLFVNIQHIVLLCSGVARYCFIFIQTFLDDGNGTIFNDQAKCQEKFAVPAASLGRYFFC